MYLISHLIFLFFIFSFIGWTIEVAYRSITNKKLINPGFLKGPYVPLYGTGGIIILIIYSFIGNEPIIYRAILYFLTISFIELISGEILLRITGKRYWDYSKNMFNIKGHVCIKFSLAWVILALIFESTILPYSLKLFDLIPALKLIHVNHAFSVFVLIDFLTTSIEHVNFQIFNNLNFSPVFQVSQKKFNNLINHINCSITDNRKNLDTIIRSRFKL